MTFYFLNLIEKEDSGLCNQIYNIAGMLDYAFHNKIKYIFVGSFLRQIYTSNICNSGEIFDFDSLNNYTGEKYGVYYFDGNNYTTKISIKYDGCDITEYILNNYIDSEGNILIPKDTKLKDMLRGEGLEGKQSNKFKIKYFINNYEFNYDYNVVNFQIGESVYLHINNKNNMNNKPFINSKINRSSNANDIKIFYDLMEHIVFQESILLKSQNYYNFLKIKHKISNSTKVNCIHLRLENDVINVLSKEQNITFEYCKQVLEEKYIYLINNFFDKNDIIIILAHNFDNKVVSYLNSNGYNYVLTDNLHKDREVCAAIDMSLGAISCNNIFLGYFQSTFSYVLFLKLRKRANRIIFTTEHITDTSTPGYYGIEENLGQIK